MRLDGRTAAITGAAGGIGRGIAVSLALIARLLPVSYWKLLTLRLRQ
jgi:NAD(P)-dependent dehydrogenase (short-subunit alcohol dehydrogenase family)